MDKEQFTIGKACEGLLLEPEKFQSKFKIYEPFRKQSNKAKDQWRDMQTEAKEQKMELLTTDNFKLATMMAESALANDRVRFWIEKRRNVQRRISFTDRKTKLPVHGFIDFDVDINEKITILDIKTDYDGEPQKWFRHAADLDYKMQVGGYTIGYYRNYYQFAEFKFIVIEKSSPYNAYVVNCDNRYIKQAQEEFKNTLLAFKYCMDNEQFDMGYDFWLFDNMDYFTMEEPRYKRSKFLVS